MKHLIAPIIITLIFLTGCSQIGTIDPLFGWPATGVEEADSLMMEYERARTFLRGQERKPEIIKRVCALSDSNPSNRILHMRAMYLSACSLVSDDGRKIYKHVSAIMSRCDSADSPFDWHALKSIKAQHEPDLYLRYVYATDNMRFFEKAGAESQLCMTLGMLGNFLLDLKDTVKAMEYYRAIERIADRHAMTAYQTVNKMNIALASPVAERPALFSSLLHDTLIERDHRVHAMVLHNAALELDSAPLFDEAIQMLRNDTRERRLLLLSRAAKGNYLIGHGAPSEGLEIVRASLDSAMEIDFPYRYQAALHSFLAEGWWALGEKDSCIAALDNSRYFMNLAESEIDRPQIYALDAKSRIEMVERTASLEKLGIASVSLLVLSGLGLVIVYLVQRSKRRRREREYEKHLMQEKLDSEQQSIRAQAKVMEEGERMISEVNAKIDELFAADRITEADAAEIRRIMQIYKGNEENRQSFLKINHELDSTFMTRLKDDFPSLAESQLKLAALLASGVDSRQIANILNTVPGSVYTSRYRLRTRLGLAPGQSLEDFLRRYNRRHIN